MDMDNERDIVEEILLNQIFYEKEVSMAAEKMNSQVFSLFLFKYLEYLYEYIFWNFSIYVMGNIEEMSFNMYLYAFHILIYLWDWVYMHLGSGGGVF